MAPKRIVPFSAPLRPVNVGRTREQDIFDRLNHGPWLLAGLFCNHAWRLIPRGRVHHHCYQIAPHPGACRCKCGATLNRLSVLDRTAEVSA